MKLCGKQKSVTLPFLTTTKLDRIMAYEQGSSSRMMTVTLQKKQRYFSNSTSPVNTKLEKIIARDVGSPPKISYQI